MRLRQGLCPWVNHLGNYCPCPPASDYLLVLYPALFSYISPINCAAGTIFNEMGQGCVHAPDLDRLFEKSCFIGNETWPHPSDCHKYELLFFLTNLSNKVVFKEQKKKIFFSTRGPRTDEGTVERTNGWTDRASYRVASPQLKIVEIAWKHFKTWRLENLKTHLVSSSFIILSKIF